MRLKFSILIVLVLTAGKNLSAQYDICGNLDKLIAEVDLKESFKNIRLELIEEKISGASYAPTPDTTRLYNCSVRIDPESPGIIEYSNMFMESWKYYIEYNRSTSDARTRMDYLLWREQIKKCLKNYGDWTYKEVTEPSSEYDPIQMMFTASKPLEDTFGFRYINVQVMVTKEYDSDDYVVTVLVH